MEEAQARLLFRIVLPINPPTDLPPLDELRTFSRPDVLKSDVQLFYQRPGVVSVQEHGLWIWEMKPPLGLTADGYERHELLGVAVYLFVSDVQHSPRIAQLAPLSPSQRPDSPRTASSRLPSQTPSVAAADGWWIYQGVEVRLTLFGYEPRIALELIQSMLQ